MTQGRCVICGKDFKPTKGDYKQKTCGQKKCKKAYKDSTNPIYSKLCYHKKMGIKISEIEINGTDTPDRAKASTLPGHQT